MFYVKILPNEVCTATTIDEVSLPSLILHEGGQVVIDHR